jgi:hypothetical protein
MFKSIWMSMETQDKLWSKFRRRHQCSWTSNWSIRRGRFAWGTMKTRGAGNCGKSGIQVFAELDGTGPLLLA